MKILHFITTLAKLLLLQLFLLKCLVVSGMLQWLAARDYIISTNESNLAPYRILMVCYFSHIL